MGDDPDSGSRERAELLGRLSLACGVLVIVAVVAFPMRSFGSGGIFGACLAVAVAGLLLGLAGLDARRACDDPRPRSPTWGVVLAVLCAIYVLLLRALVGAVVTERRVGDAVPFAPVDLGCQALVRVVDFLDQAAVA